MLCSIVTTIKRITNQRCYVVFEIIIMKLQTRLYYIYHEMYSYIRKPLFLLLLTKNVFSFQVYLQIRVVTRYILQYFVFYR